MYHPSAILPHGRCLDSSSWYAWPILLFLRYIYYWIIVGPLYLQAHILEFNQPQIENIQNKNDIRAEGHISLDTIANNIKICIAFTLFWVLQAI